LVSGFSENGAIEWHKNLNYLDCELIVKSPEFYNQFAIEPGKSIYSQFEENPLRFEFVPQPQIFSSKWKAFIP